MELMVVHCVVDCSGGVYSIIKNLIMEQKKRGIKVAIIYSLGEIENETLFSDLEIIKVRSKKRYMFTGLDLYDQYQYFKKKYAEKKVILHIHNTSAVGLFNRIYKIPFLCTIHGVNTRGFISNLIMFLILLKMKNKNKQLIGVSDQTTNYYNKQICNDYVKTIHNGVLICKRNTLLNKSDKEKFSIGFVSNLNDFKGWKFLAEAYNLLSPEIKKITKLHLVGRISKESEGDLNSFLSNYSKDNVEYYGEIPNAGMSITPYLDCVVLPTKWEGIPVCLLEGMGNGVPILATNVGGIPEILIDGKDGLIINRDSKNIAEKLTYLIKNETATKMMGAYAKTLFDKQFTAGIMNDKYMRIYEIIAMS